MVFWFFTNIRTFADNNNFHLRGFIHISVILILLLLELLWGNVWHLLISADYEKALFLVRSLRLPRVFNCIVAGAGLSLTGLLLQTLFRNPLAGPYILGISSGAAFGVALSLMFFSSVAWVGSVVLALAGAALVIWLIVYLSWRFSLTTVIIAGVLITGIFSALINVLQYFSPAYDVKNFVLWTMASVDGNISAFSLFTLAVTVFVLLFVLKNADRYDALYFGQDYALSMGVDFFRLKTLTLLLTGVIVALLTVNYGPVAFVGVISPHIARMFSPTLRHKALTGQTVLWGISVMLFADWLSHLFPVVLPVNTALSLIGLPMLFYLIFVKKL